MADRHEPRPVGGLPAVRPAGELEVVVLFPWDPLAERFAGERIWFDRGALP